MKPAVYDFKEFYASPMGAVTARAVTQAIQKLWPDMTGRRVVVFGYGAPYHRLFQGTDRLVYFMPPDQGAYPWPEGEGHKNHVALSARTALPIESNMLDGVVLIHSLEYTNAIDLHLDEIWRTLKSNGRLMIIVPNRLGFWSRVEWSPFGQGMPFTLGQVHRYLRDALFIPERHVPTLFSLPIRSRILMRLGPFLEKYMPYVAPWVSGLHVVEASKQVYAGLTLPVKERAVNKTRVNVPVVAPAPVSKRDSLAP